MAYIKTKAIVINKKAYKENDVLVTALSQNLGKIFFIAKGASSHKSHRNATLQLGNLIQIDLYQKNDFYWLSDSKTIKNFIKTDKSLNQIKYAFYFLEIINQLVAQDQDTLNLFDKSIKIFEAIETKSFSKYVDYQIDFINMLGFGIPNEISKLQQQKKYPSCLEKLIDHIESIIQNPLQSSKIV